MKKLKNKAKMESKKLKPEGRIFLYRKPKMTIRPKKYLAVIVINGLFSAPCNILTNCTCCAFLIKYDIFGTFGVMVSFGLLVFDIYGHVVFFGN